jgi:long-chain acyl-CoA synthetase
VCAFRFGLSAGGPLNGEVQQFIRVAFGMDLVQGYGLTENLIGLAVQAADDLRTGIAGAPVASVEVKLESTPEICDPKGIPYLSTDIVDVEGNVVFGRGEIACRGPGVSCGYYMMPDATKESFKVIASSRQISAPFHQLTRCRSFCLRMVGFTQATLGNSCRMVVYAL